MTWRSYVGQFSFEICSILFKISFTKNFKAVYTPLVTELIGFGRLIRFDVLGVTQGEKREQCFFPRATVWNSNKIELYH